MTLKLVPNPRKPAAIECHTSPSTVDAAKNISSVGRAKGLLPGQAIGELVLRGMRLHPFGSAVARHANR